MATTKTMTVDEKKKLVIKRAAQDGGVTVTEIKDDLDGHAGRTALLFTAMCRSGSLSKTDKKREGKWVYTTNDKTKSAAKTPKTKTKVKKTTKAAVTTTPSPKVVEETTLLNSAAQADTSVQDAKAAGEAVGRNLVEVQRQINAFIDGLRRTLNN